MAEKDLISREAAIALARNHVGHTIDINDIARIPAVDAVPVVHGRWEYGMRCTHCGQVDLARPNYCPNCGARMDGEVDSDRGEKHCIVDGTNVTITNEPFVIEGGFVVDVGKKADNALE